MGGTFSPGAPRDPKTAIAEDSAVASDVQGHLDATLCLKLLISTSWALSYRPYDTF